MQIKKVKIFAGILALILLVLTVTGIVFQFGIRHSLGSKIQDEMTWQIEQYERWLVQENSDSYITPDYGASLVTYSLLAKNWDQLIPITMLNVTKKEALEEEGMYSGIVRYCLEHPEMSREGTYRETEIDGTTHYLMMREYDRPSQSPAGDNGRYMAIFMATPEKMYDFVGKVQLLFALVMLALGIVLFFGSYRIGMRFEKDKQKLTRYFQNTSHELKTPIMSIQGYAEGIATGVLTDHEKAAGVIMAQSDRMSELVEEILVLSKMDSGYADRTREVINVSDLLCDCLNRICEQAAQKGIELQVHLPEELWILGNEPQLERAFGNILSNGIRYARGLIRVEAFRERKWIRVEISDDGNGIAPEDLPHIFDRFYKGTGGQHGIGLAITREIVALHKGRIRVYSRNGAQFCVWLRRKV